MSRARPAPGPAVLVVFWALPAALWLRAALEAGAFSTLAAGLTAVGIALGLAGLSSFALNLVLGARLGPVERVFGGLERMYVAHRRNGTVAFALLAGHFVMLVTGRVIAGDGALGVLDGGFGPWLGVGALAGMAVALWLTLYARLGHEVFVWVQRSFGILFVLGAVHAFGTGTARGTSPALDWYLRALVATGVAAFLYRSVFGDVLVRRARYRVADVVHLDDRVTEIAMEPLGPAIDHLPGQFAFVNFRGSVGFERQFHPVSVEASGQSAVLTLRPGDIANQFHPFSITSAPGDPVLRIAVKAVGDYTSALRALEPGALAIVEGPYGSFSHRNVTGRRQVWLSGGIGLTPFLAMARSLRASDPYEIVHLFCVENEREAYLLEEFERVQSDVPGYRVVPVLRERDGLVDVERIEAESGSLDDREFLICGPPAMISSLEGALETRGVTRGRIHAEGFGFARLPGSTQPRRPRARPLD